MQLTPVLLAICLIAAQSPPTGKAEAIPVQTEVPLVRAHGLLYVELAWKGEPLLALVDTGANASAIDPKRAAGLPVVKEAEVLGTTGTLRAESVALEGIRLGDMELSRLVATRRDLGGLLQPEGRRPEMILGSDAFLGRALTIDFEKKRIELGPSTPAPSDGKLQPGETLMRLDEGMPCIPATLVGLEAELRIDSGASLFESKDVYVNVPKRVWEQLRERDSSLEPSSSLRGSGASGEAVELPVVRIGRSRVGPLDFEALYLIVQPEAGYFARENAKGFVGVNWLEKLRRVTLDYGSGRLRAHGH